MEEKALIPIERINRAIIFLRGHKVMLDTDLAEIYNVKTSRLNEQVKRNFERFPPDFMFQLTEEEKAEVIANCDHLEKLKYSKTNPYAFTEHGAIMLATVLNTTTAVQTSILIVRAFVKLREILSSHKELSGKLTEMEQKYDKQFRIVFKAIRELMQQETFRKDRPRIGFKIGNSGK